MKEFFEHFYRVLTQDACEMGNNQSCYSSFQVYLCNIKPTSKLFLPCWSIVYNHKVVKVETIITAKQ